MKVFEALAEALRAEGVKTLFGLMGDANMSLWSVLLARGIAQIHSARNEAGAVAMADGYHRATGRVGVATVTCGPGLTQIGTSLMAASRNRSAIVIVTGEWPVNSPNDLQVMDQRRFVEACEARYVAARPGPRLAQDIASAFCMAQLRRCPVVLAVPNELQDAEFTGNWHYVPSVERLPAAATTASAQDTALLVQALRDARHPILLAGRGARQARARQQIIDLAERTGALLGTTLQVRGMFSEHPWSMGLIGGYGSAATTELCGQADLVIGIGARIEHYTSWGGTLFPQARVIRIDNADPPVDLSQTPGTYIRGDAAQVLDQVLYELAEVRPTTGFRTNQTKALLTVPGAAHREAQGGLDPRMAALRLSELLDKECRLTCGVGHFQGFAVNYMTLPQNIDVEYSVQFGAVGQTLPLAIGIGAANPHQRHVVIEGDGSLLMNIQELDLATTSGLPMTLIVWNDGGYGAEAHRLPGKGFSAAPATWKSPDFVAIARGFGADGMRVESWDDLNAAMQRARETSGLFLIDLRISPQETSDTYLKNFYAKPNQSPFQP